MRLRSLSLIALILIVFTRPAVAQDAAETVVRPALDNVTRVESWSFFEPPPGGGDPDYTLFTNRAHLGVEVESRRLWFEGSFQYAQLIGLPRHAVGPGPLGPGAQFFAAARTPEAYQLYFKTMSLGLKDVLPSLSLQAGRMRYQSGAGTPFAGRLIGMAEWTPFERSFDGLRVDYARPAWRGHASFVMPTQGAFEESASPTIGKVQLTNASWANETLEVFAHNYRDRRAVSARPDNTAIPVDSIDINVQTLGMSLDLRGVRAWGAVQRGTWFDTPHRAFSVSADIGHQWRAWPWRPSVRGGLLHASGDEDPNDDRHGTFFPMVPGTQPAALGGTFAQMNLRNVYANAFVHPRDSIRLGVELHRLSLVQRLDGWYSGAGATAFSGNYFGFSSRRSTLRHRLGTLVQLSAAATVRPYWTVSASTAVMRGGQVVGRQFAGRTLIVTSLESVLSFR